MSIGALDIGNTSHAHQVLNARFGARYRVWQGALPAALACAALWLLCSALILRRPCGGSSTQTVHPTKPTAQLAAGHACAGPGQGSDIPTSAMGGAHRRLVLVHTAFATHNHSTPARRAAGSCTQGLCALLVGAVDVVFRCAAATLVLADWAKVGLGSQARMLHPLLLVPAEWWHFVAACLGVALAMVAFVRKDRATLPLARTSCITACDGAVPWGRATQVVPAGLPHGGAEGDLPRSVGTAMCDVLVAMWGRGLASALLLPASYLLLSVFACGYTGTEVGPGPALAGNGASAVGQLYSVTSRCSSVLACFTPWHWVAMVASLALVLGLLFVYGPLAHAHTLDGGLGVAHCLPLTVPGRIALAYAVKVLVHRTPLGALALASACNTLLFVCAAVVAMPPRRARALAQAANSAGRLRATAGPACANQGGRGTAPATQPAQGFGPTVARAVLLVSNGVCFGASAAAMALRLVMGTPSTPLASIAAAGAMLMLVAVLAWLSYLYLVTPDREVAGAAGGPRGSMDAHQRFHLWLYGYAAVTGSSPHQSTFTRIVVGAACPRVPDVDPQAPRLNAITAAGQVGGPAYDEESPRVAHRGNGQREAWPRAPLVEAARARAAGTEGAAGVGMGDGTGDRTRTGTHAPPLGWEPDVPGCWAATHPQPTPGTDPEGLQDVDEVEEAARPRGLDKELVDGARAAVRAERNADTVAQFLRRH